MFFNRLDGKTHKNSNYKLCVSPPLRLFFLAFDSLFLFSYLLNRFFNNNILVIQYLVKSRIPPCIPCQ